MENFTMSLTPRVSPIFSPRHVGGEDCQPHGASQHTDHRHSRQGQRPATVLRQVRRLSGRHETVGSYPWGKP